MNKLLLLLGLVGLGFGSWFVYRYLYPSPSVPAAKSDLVAGGVFLVVALVCFAVFFFKKFREEGDQDISITKF
jgi:hypothetical protein